MALRVAKHIHWLGHDGFYIDDDRVIYIDPYQIGLTQPKADLILITHEHYDHFSMEDIAKIRRPDTTFVGPAAVAKQLRGNAVVVVKAGDHTTVNGVEIDVVPAYNLNKRYHPKAAGGVGYIITIEGTRIYHAGDTDLIPEMADVKADIAILPVGGTYTMTADEAAQAVKRIGPTLAIPMHYGTVAGKRSDAERFARQSSAETLILEPEG